MGVTVSYHPLLATILCTTSLIQPVHVEIHYHHITIFTIAAGIGIMVGYWFGSRNRPSASIAQAMGKQDGLQIVPTKPHFVAVKPSEIETLQAFIQSSRIRGEIKKRMGATGEQDRTDITNQVLGEELQKLYKSYRITKKHAAASPSRAGVYSPYDMQDPHYQEVLAIVTKHNPPCIQHKPKWWADRFNECLRDLQPTARKPLRSCRQEEDDEKHP